MTQSPDAGRVQPTTRSRRRILTVVSGGQTGVDRAALDAAMACGLTVGGWCPAGRRAEDGRIDDRYPLRETPREAYRQRTVWNVRDADATLVLTDGEPAGGTALTIDAARASGRPWMQVDLRAEPEPATVQAWIDANGIRTLNVAGPRASEAPEIYERARRFLERLFAGEPREEE